MPRAFQSADVVTAVGLTEGVIAQGRGRVIGQDIVQIPDVDQSRRFVHFLDGLAGYQLLTPMIGHTYPS